MYPTVPRRTPAAVPPDCRCELRTEVGCGRRQLRKSEVEDLDQPVARHHHVVGLQVAMDDAGAVRLRQPFRDLRADLDNGGCRLWLTRGNEFPQRGAIHPLHRDVGRGPLDADVVDGDDVGVIQGGSGTSFALKSLDCDRDRRPGHAAAP